MSARRYRLTVERGRWRATPIAADGAPLGRSSPLVARFRALLAESALVEFALERLSSFEPRAWLVSGALAQSAWNALTGRGAYHGIDDLDCAYCDRDTSWAAENAVIERGAALLEGAGLRAEFRNQARVPRWYSRKFGFAFPRVRNAECAVEAYPSKTTALALRREPDGAEVLYAPFGVRDVLEMRVRPNRRLPVGDVYRAKTERWRARWPELRIAPWRSTP